MKKALVTLVLSLMPLSAFASPTPIPQAELGNYKKAVSLAIHAGDWNCFTVHGIGPYGFIYEDAVNAATSGEIDNSGSQPLLIFTTLANDGSSESVVSITSSSDYKSALSMHAEYLVKGDINSGTLANPVIVTGFQSQFSGKCENSSGLIRD